MAKTKVQKQSVVRQGAFLDPNSNEYKIAECFRKTAIEIFAHDGFLIPYLFVFNGGPVIATDLRKLDPDEVAEVTKRAFTTFRFVMKIGEAWEKRAEKSECWDANNLPEGHVKDMPGAVEVAAQTVYVNAVDFSWVAKINRTGKKPFLEEWKEVGQMTGGRCSPVASICPN